ncbi:MAG: alanyl-tRNA synthetase, partial [Clostridiales bacterium]|nr:alanyl-tRNA synthetase [Clostridiales bacterium]
QRKKARDARAETNYMGADVTVYQSIDPAITTSFVGYDCLTHTSKITVLTTEEELVQGLCDGQTGTIIVEETPFYATMGGQQADIGTITSKDSVFVVEDTIKLQGGKVGHVGKMTSGMLKVGDFVTLTVEERNRQLTAKNHTATHLLQKALRMVLGNHVEQAGSLVNADRLRFDFTHFSALTPEELKRVEEIVNQEIAKAIAVKTDVMTLEEAKNTGAMALFGEKYGETVRVVRVDDFSVELCGGTHIANTNAIAAFKIVSEAGIAAGVRRIEALTSEGLFAYYASLEQEIYQAARAAKTDVAGIVKKIESMQEEMKALHAENQKLKDKMAKSALGDVMDQVVDVNGVKLLATRVDDVDMNGLRTLGDQLKDKLKEGVIFLASKQDGKVNLISMATEKAMEQGAHAGNLIKKVAAIVGGGGGGRPNMAQAGGKDPAAIPAALDAVKEELASQLQKN